MKNDLRLSPSMRKALRRMQLGNPSHADRRTLQALERRGLITTDPHFRCFLTQLGKEVEF